MTCSLKHWSWDDADAPVKVNGSTNTENNARFHSKWQQTHNRKSARPKCTQEGDMKYKPYNEQNHGSVPDHTTKTMKEGEIAPLDASYPTMRVLSASRSSRPTTGCPPCTRAPTGGM